MIAPEKISYERTEPGEQCRHFVKYFWNLRNYTDEPKLVTILPDGFFDIVFYSENSVDFKIELIGLATKPIDYTITPFSNTYAISFKLPAAEYILKTNISALNNNAKELAADFWNFREADLNSFHNFISKSSGIVTRMIPLQIDNRKFELFEKIYASNGAVPVEQLATEVFWTSRQINRYFKKQFGITLKEYCTILRYRASFDHLKEGQLFPEENYYDQAHFIREVKKYSGVTPKELAKNENDRFIQLSTLPPP